MLDNSKLCLSKRKIWLSMLDYISKLGFALQAISVFPNMVTKCVHNTAQITAVFNTGIDP